MSVNQDFPVLDGIAPSWADIACTATAAGIPLISMKDIKSINTGTTLEVGEQRGASGGRVMKRSTGSGKHEASAELYYDGYIDFIRKLKGLAPLRGGKQRVIGLVHFGFVMQFTPPGSEEIFETRIKGCRFLGRDINPAEGNDVITVPIKLNPLEIVDMVDGEEVVII
jgi:hypothetical protein